MMCLWAEGMEWQQQQDYGHNSARAYPLPGLQHLLEYLLVTRHLFNADRYLSSNSSHGSAISTQ
jgi:hypothetical protein